MQTRVWTGAAVFLFAGLIVAAGCSGPAPGIAEAESLDQAKELAEARDALILMDFYTDW
jgi:hypothetical protein